MMQKIVLIILAVMVLCLLMPRTSSSASYGDKRLNNQFVSLCPPGMMPASYTTAGGDCVPYYF